MDKFVTASYLQWHRAFRAVGRTEEEAFVHLQEGFNAWCDANERSRKSLRRCFCQFQEYEVGAVYMQHLGEPEKILQVPVRKDDGPPGHPLRGRLRRDGVGAMKTGDIFYRAWVETRSYMFEGFGLSDESARQACMRAWEAHVRQFEAGTSEVNRGDFDPNYITIEDMCSDEVMMGESYRDRERIQ